MTVSAVSAAKTICEMRGWGVSNLELQKILYVAHMLHIGETGKPLLRENFEAWEYGPVIPDVYRRARAFGAGAVRNVFHWVSPVARETPEYRALKRAVEMTRDMSPGKLVNVTHWKNGAWYKNYRSGMKGITIPNRDIVEEFHARKRRAHA